MTGLDKIVHQILKEAEDAARRCAEEAQEEAQNIRTVAREQATKIQEEGLKTSKIEVDNYKERRTSAIDLYRRTAILQAKQEVIEDVLQKAYDKFCKVSEVEYFENLEKMLDKFVLAREGEIYFSSKDLARMPKEFVESVDKVAKAKGGTLEIAKEAREMAGGFILVYGGVEENCSFQALFDANRAKLQDQVYKILFSCN